MKQGDVVVRCQQIGFFGFFVLVSTGFIVLLLAGLRSCSQGIDEQNTSTLKAAKQTVTLNTAVSPADDLYGKEAEHAVVEAEKYSISLPSHDGRLSLANHRNKENIANLIAKIHNSDSPKKVQMVQTLWLIAADMGVPDEALETMEHLVQYDSNPLVAEKAAQAAKDLHHLKKMVNEQDWTAESSQSTMQNDIQDQLGHGGANFDPNDQDASALDDLRTDVKSGSIQVSKNNYFDRREALSELVTALDDSDPARKVQLINEIWRLSADVDAPDMVLETLEYIADNDLDVLVAEAAMYAIEDLNNLSIAHNNEFSNLNSGIAENKDILQDQLMDQQIISAMNVQGEAVTNDVAMNNSTPDQWQQNSDTRIDELADRALLDPYEENRYRAIEELSSIRSETAVEILLQAALDPSASNRLKAIECLWLSAADGMDVYGDILVSIQQAVADSDERVSNIAGKALTDLEHLMESSR